MIQYHPRATEKLAMGQIMWSMLITKHVHNKTPMEYGMFLADKKKRGRSK